MNMAVSREISSDLRHVTRDHLIPPGRAAAFPGLDPHDPDNIVPACFSCNVAKGNMTEQELRSAYPTVEQIRWLESREARDARAAQVLRRARDRVARREMARCVALHELSCQF